MHVYMHLYTHTHTHIDLHVYSSIHIHITYTYAHTYTIYMYTYIYEYMYMYMYIHIYISIYICRARRHLVEPQRRLQVQLFRLPAYLLALPCLAGLCSERFPMGHLYAPLASLKGSEVWAPVLWGVYNQAITGLSGFRSGRTLRGNHKIQYYVSHGQHSV